MFNIDKKEIGNFISRLIDNKYDSARQFCIAYLKESKEEPTDEKIQNMANRLSQIKNGKKEIQIYDLPIFSKLLDVSYEQILSAGKSGDPKHSRMTNYTIAQSHNKKEWKAYIELPGTPILSPDEYGKTVLEYAIMFGNYDFLKFLMDEKYIWFDSRKDNDYVMTFGAGTSIQRIRFEEHDNKVFVYPPQMNDLQCKLRSEDQLRMHIISLAADHNDLKMLEQLRAREIPELYYRVHYLAAANPDINAHYDKDMVSHIAKSSDTVLDYFTNSFEIRDKYRYKDGSNRKHTFVFPYISQLLDMLIENNSPFLRTALEKAIEHNETTMEKLILLIKQAINNGCYKNYGDGWPNEVEFSENGNIVGFHDCIAGTIIITNIANVSKKSKDAQINLLIKNLNKSYDSIRNIKMKNYV